MSGQRFKGGERVVVSQTPVDGFDKQYAGKVGTVDKYSHKNGDRDVYLVTLDGDRELAFYDADLLPYGELQSLRVELAQAEDEVARLQEAVRAKERDAVGLPVGTVLAYRDTYGPAAITKQAENVWLNLFPTQARNPNTELLDDREVTLFLGNHHAAVVHKP